MKKRLLAGILAVAAIGSVSAQKVVAHRGYWDIAGSAQNSVRSLVKADSIGCEACEFDVWLTPDRQLVVNHDGKINGYVIENTSSDTICSQKLENGEYLPTLDAYLDAAKDLKINLVLELKPHKNPANENIAVEMIMKMIKEKGLEDRMIYITFSKNAFKEFVRTTDRPKMFLTGVDPDELKAMGATGADYHFNVYRKNPGWIERIHEMGMNVNAWTVNKAEDIKWCLDNGVDMITTNNPELVQKMRAEKNK